MKINDLKNLNKSELQERLIKLRSEVTDVSFDLRTGQEKDTSLIGKKKKEISRILTLQNMDKVISKGHFKKIKNTNSDEIAQEE